MNTSLRILFIHEVNYETKPIFEFHEFPEGLAARGHEVSVFHFPEGRNSLSASWSRGSRTKLIRGRALPGVEIRLITPWVLGGGLAGRLLAVIASPFQLLSAIREVRPDVIVLLAVPTFGWQTVLISKFLNVPVLFRALDVSHKIRKSIFQPLIKLAEKVVYRSVDEISANNPAMLEYCQSLAGLRLKGDVHLPPIDLSFFRSGNRRSGREILGLGETDKVIVYLGSFFYFSGLADVISAFGRKSGEEKLLLIGGGEMDSELRDLTRELNLEERVIFTGFQPFSALPDLLMAADIAINPMSPESVSHMALPNKVLQYLACGLPTVSTKLDGLYSIFGDDVGIFWAIDSAETLEIALELAASGTPKLEIGSAKHLDAFEPSRALTNLESTLVRLASQ